MCNSHIERKVNSSIYCKLQWHCFGVWRSLCSLCSGENNKNCNDIYMYLYSCNNVALSPFLGEGEGGGEGYPSPLLQLVPVLNLLHVVTKLNVQFTSYMKISNNLILC